MILFNRDGDGGIEITKALGLISDRVDFSTWAPILPLGLRDVIAIIGREPVEALAEYYEAGDDNDERKSRALAYLQQSVALFSWLKIIPTLDAMHDNTGRAKRIGGERKGDLQPWNNTRTKQIFYAWRTRQRTRLLSKWIARPSTLDYIEKVPPALRPSCTK